MSTGCVQTVCTETGSLTELEAELACQKSSQDPCLQLTIKKLQAPRHAWHFTRMLEISDLGGHASTVNPLNSEIPKQGLYHWESIHLGFFLQLATLQRDQREEEVEDTRDGAGDGECTREPSLCPRVAWLTGPS